MLRITIDTLESPMRVDRYLRIMNNTLTQGAIEKALRSGHIKIPGKKIQSNYRIDKGDVLLLADYLLPATTKSTKQFSSNVIALAEKITGEYLLHEDDYFLVINKPTNLATQGGSKISISVDHALEYLNSTGYDLRIAHRLDKDTSGVLLITKTRRTATIIGKALENKCITKKYLAVLQGHVASPSGTIESYLSKIESGVITTTKANGKIAITQYKVIKNHEDTTVVEFTPLTGRMHQLRCHAAFELKTPIVGDKKYGYDGNNDVLMLHAWHLTIPEEIFGTKYHFTAPIPKYFSNWGL